MREIRRTALLALLAMTALMSYAFADVAAGPVYALMFGLPVFFIALVVVVMVVILRSVLRAAKRQKEGQTGTQGEKREQVKDISCRHADADTRARKNYWDNRDPWDEDRK